MKTQDLISVIVPIYNVEKYLAKCIDSILNQSYENLEIILVDDGSPDNCPAICDEYAKKDKRIKVIHKQNGGLSDARNFGIEASTGKYISFIDSDDYINKYFIETLYNNLIETNSDLSICGFIRVDENTIIDNDAKPTKQEIFTFENLNKFNQLHKDNRVAFIVAWNKLYKSELFKTTQTRYPVGKIHEDEFVIHEILNNCKKICFSETVLYYYLVRNNSIMNQKLSEKNLSFYEALENRTDFLKTQSQDLYFTSLIFYLNFLYNNFYKYNKPAKKQLSTILRKFIKKNKSAFKNLKFKMRLKLYILLYLKPIYYIHKFFKK